MWMSDEEFEFRKDSADKKNIARSAGKRVGNRRGCKLPCDNLTPAQIKNLNGEVFSMNLNKPINYREFKLLSKDIQEQYLTHLINEYHVSYHRIARMMGLSGADALINYIRTKKLNVPAPRKGLQFNTKQQSKWDAFCAGELGNEEPSKPEENPPIDISEMTDTEFFEEIKKQADKANGAAPAESTKFTYVRNSFDCHNGDRSAIVDMAKLIASYPWPNDISVTISVSATRPQKVDYGEFDPL